MGKNMDIMNISSSCHSDFLRQVEEESGQNLSLCYQCGKCTAGCPYSLEYDIPVSRIMRLVQIGRKEQVLRSESLWLCATCESCSVRCPNEIDVARIMDVLRHMARKEGYAGIKTIKTFWDSFLGSARKNGRIFEVGLLMKYITQTGRFWTDLTLGPRMLPKGKIHFTPHVIKGKKEVAAIFRRYEEEYGK